MKLKKKLLIALVVSLLLIVTSIGGTFLYYYSHPDSVQRLIAKIISSSTGMECTIQNLSYSLDPLTVRAERITLSPFEDQTGFHLRISDLAAGMSLEGRFGRKTLIIKHVRIHKFLLDVPEPFVMPEYKTEQGSSSFLSQIFGRTVTWFMFRDISFKELAVLDGQVTALFGERKMAIKGIRANMNPDHLIEISCNLVVEWPSLGILFTAPEIHVTTQDAISLKAPQIAGFLEATEAAFHSPDIDVTEMETKGAIQYSLENNILDFDPIEFQFDGVHLKQDPDTPWPPLQMKAQIRGSLNIEDRILNVTEFDLNADDILQLEGKMDIGIGTQTDIRLDILKGYLVSDRLLALLPDDTMEGVTVNVSGPILFQGEIGGRKKDEDWGFHTDLYAGLDGNRISYMRDQTQFDAMLSGELRISGELPKLSLSADLKSEQIRMEMGTRDLLMKQVQIKVTEGEMDIESKSLVLPEIRFESSLLRNVHASLALEQGVLNLELQGEDVHLIESAHMFKLMPPGWRFDGLSSLKMSIMQKRKKGWTFTSQIGLRSLAFEDPNSGYLGEALSLLLEVNGGMDPRRSTVVFRTVLTADEGELLVDRFYLDLSKNGFSSSLEGTYDIPRHMLQLSSHQIQLRDILGLTLEGTLHLVTGDPHVDFSVKIPKTSLKPLFHHFVLEPFQTEKPFLASLDLAGDISADLNFTGSTSEWMIKGHGWWDEGRFASADMTFDLSGIDLDLPIWLQAQDNGQQPEPIRGKLFIQNLNMPVLDNQPLELSLKMHPNQFSIDEPMALIIPGGVAQVGPILCEDIMSSKRSVKTSLRLDGIDTGPLFSQFLAMPVHGTVKGELDAVYFEKNALHSSGQIRAQVFEGEILLSNLGVSGLFSSFPLYKADITIKDLNLYELTKGTSFGEIEGILQGYIHNLEITNGQPQKFDLLLETVKTKGIDQKISVKAMDNIARIGGGESPFMGLSGAFITVFEKLSYSKIGIRASLTNDSFRIKGSDWEGGPDYLVKSGGIPRVDVVNHSPDMPISFKAMIKRIKGIMASKSGPVVE
jgi:hypothetical protein